MTLSKKDYQELFDTLTPRMQKQLIEYATQYESIHNNPAEEPEHGDFKMEGNTLWL